MYNFHLNCMLCSWSLHFATSSCARKIEKKWRTGLRLSVRVLRMSFSTWVLELTFIQTLYHNFVLSLLYLFMTCDTLHNINCQPPEVTKLWSQLWRFTHLAKYWLRQLSIRLYSLSIGTARKGVWLKMLWISNRESDRHYVYTERSQIELPTFWYITGLT